MRLFSVLALLVVGIAVVGWAGMTGLSAEAGQVQSLHADHLRTMDLAARTRSDLHTLYEAGLRLIPTDTPGAVGQLQIRIDDVLLPALRRDLDDLAVQTEDDGEEAAQLARVSSAVQDFQAVRRTGGYEAAGTSAKEAARDTALATRTANVFEAALASLDRIAGIERAQAEQAVARGAADYRNTRRTVLAVAAGAVAVGLALGAALTRSLVPRIRGYAQFA